MLPVLQLPVFPALLRLELLANTVTWLSSQVTAGQMNQGHHSQGSCKRKKSDPEVFNCALRHEETSGRQQAG